MGSVDRRVAPFLRPNGGLIVSPLLRSCVCIRRPAEVKARFVTSIVMGLILGTIYFGQDDTQKSAKNVMGLFFLLNMFQVMTSMFGVLQVRLTACLSTSSPGSPALRALLRHLTACRRQNLTTDSCMTMPHHLRCSRRR
jgi:hypothetical protein